MLHLRRKENFIDKKLGQSYKYFETFEYQHQIEKNTVEAWNKHVYPFYFSQMALLISVTFCSALYPVSLKFSFNEPLVIPENKPKQKSQICKKNKRI